MCETDPKHFRINQSSDRLDLTSEAGEQPLVSVLPDIFLSHISSSV